MRTTAGANWNVVALILDTPPRAQPASAGGGIPRSGRRRVKDTHLVERSVYTPYGELIVEQAERDRGGSVKGFGDRDGDADVDGTDKGTLGVTCTGTVTGSCRILDLDPVLDTSRWASPSVLDTPRTLRVQERRSRAANQGRSRAAGGDESRIHGDYDSADATLFDALPQGIARHPGRASTGVDQPFAHQGLFYDAEITQYQNRHRQYDPAKRRFLQRDPLGYMHEYFHGNSTGNTTATAPFGFWSAWCRWSCRRYHEGCLNFLPPVICDAWLAECIWNCNHAFGTQPIAHGIQREFLGARAYYQDGLNLHAYVSANPVGRLDPSGLGPLEKKHDSPRGCALCVCARCLLLPNCTCCLCLVCDGMIGLFFVVVCP